MKKPKKSKSKLANYVIGRCKLRDNEGFRVNTRIRLLSNAYANWCGADHVR